MAKKMFLAVFFVLISYLPLLAWTNCPPAALVPNPNPVTTGIKTCIAKAESVSLHLNESWSKEVKLSAGQSYWFSASKCARAYAMFAKVTDEKGDIVIARGGSGISFCFCPPKTGMYTISYEITGLNGSYSYAITKACLSRSDCEAQNHPLSTFERKKMEEYLEKKIP